MAAALSEVYNYYCPVKKVLLFIGVFCVVT